MRNSPVAIVTRVNDFALRSTSAGVIEYGRPGPKAVGGADVPDRIASRYRLECVIGIKISAKQWYRCGTGLSDDGIPFHIDHTVVNPYVSVKNLR